MKKLSTGAKRIYDASEWQNVALNLCAGRYQRGIVRGSQDMSGADLRGKAGQYRGRYNASRDALIKRMKRAGVPHVIEKDPQSRKITLYFLAGPVA